MSTQRTILIVEDEMIISLDMEDTLEQAGHNVVTASTVREAKQMLDAGGIDMVLLDYHVTDGDTDQLMVRLHEAGLPFLICSGLASADRPGDVFPDRPVLAKPFTTDGLIAAITALMGACGDERLRIE